MTCHLCACGTEIRYNCVKDINVHCSGCDREYTVDKETGKLIPPIKEFNLNKRDAHVCTHKDGNYCNYYKKEASCGVNGLLYHASRCPQFNKI